MLKCYKNDKFCEYVPKHIASYYTKIEFPYVVANAQIQNSSTKQFFTKETLVTRDIYDGDE